MAGSRKECDSGESVATRDVHPTGRSGRDGERVGEDAPVVAALTELIEQLVAIDSVNPTLVPGARGEDELARFVAAWLSAHGLDVDVEEVAPGRPNVIATVRGHGGGRTLLLNAHTDTVGLAGMRDGLRLRQEDGRLYGRGAYDMKASLAVIMLVAAELARRPPSGELVVTAVVDEEAASIGTEAVARSVRADAAIVAEPTELGVAVGHRGFVWVEIEVRGLAAHGSRYDLGVDAIARMGHILVGLERLDAELRARQPHRLLGCASIHAGVIEGGEGVSTYPDRCVLQVERRTLPGETVGDVEREARKLLGGLDGDVRVRFAREPLSTSDDEEIVRLVARHAGADGTIGVPFWTDAALLAEAGIPTVVFGPAGDGAHADVEWVDLASVERCYDVLLATARGFCA
jgi:acetylornithine deacetylase/succinyl-diaminopimelate desuccinylase-like protein